MDIHLQTKEQIFSIELVDQLIQSEFAKNWTNIQSLGGVQLKIHYYNNYSELNIKTLSCWQPSNAFDKHFVLVCG